MLTLPTEIMIVLQHFSPVVSERIWDWAQVLVIGAILAPRQRTVTAILRIMGLSGERQFQNYHRVLNRAQWSGLRVSRILLSLVVAAFVRADAPVIIAADETLERRRGQRIATKGHFRDPVLSSEKHHVASEGLRWVSMMLLVTVPWSQRVWALPFLTVLAPHEETNQALGKRHKTSIDWVQQMTSQVRRWLPQRQIILITDGGLIAVKLGLRCNCYRQPVTFISRLHLNIRLFDPPAPNRRKNAARVGQRQPTLQHHLDDPHTPWTRQTVSWYGAKTRSVEWVSDTALWHTPSQKQPLPIRWVLVRDPLGKFKPAAFGSTDLTLSAEQIIALYVLRWNVEVTFEECRAHLGLETQRQWNPLAIARTTPAILGLFSLVVLLAHHLTADQSLPMRSTAWYTKSEATFSDVIALVRRYLWLHVKCTNSLHNTRFVLFPATALDDVLDALCYAT
ncbi:MAG: transposase [Sulfuricella denitrificans]|nr:transposase [Sulfuricella denitrificans]